MFLGEAQEYAGMNWCHHVHLSLQIAGKGKCADLGHIASMIGAVRDFASGSIETWINTLIYKKMVDSVVKTLDKIMQCSHVGLIT